MTIGVVGHENYYVMHPYFDMILYLRLSKDGNLHVCFYQDMSRIVTLRLRKGGKTKTQTELKKVLRLSGSKSW